MSVSEALHCGSPVVVSLSCLVFVLLPLALVYYAHTSPAEFLLVSCVQFALSKLWVIAELSVKLLCGPYILSPWLNLAHILHTHTGTLVKNV